MRVFIAGDWHSDLHEQEMLKAVRRMGHEVGEFKWYGYYTASPGLLLSDLIQRVQNKYVLGPTLARVNRDFVKNVEAFRPDVVFVYRGTHITRESLCEIRRMFPSCLLLGYNNDNPFSITQPKYLWRHFMRATPVYDLMLAYRHENPDGHPKLLHCWPVKLLQAGRGDYAGSGLMARRAAASLSR